MHRLPTAVGPRNRFIGGMTMNSASLDVCFSCQASAAIYSRVDVIDPDLFGVATVATAQPNRMTVRKNSELFNWRQHGIK
jgi:hypothetical protein